MDLKTFFEQFDTIAEAPGGIQRLRSLILDMAVRGKLVPQDPDDEPANFLLQKIQIEIKQKSSKSKKSKKQASEILPFPLPKGWISVSLEDISIEVHYGLTASASHENTDIKFLRITDIQNDSVNWLSVPGCNIDKEKAKKYRLKNADIVIARTGGTVGKSYLVESLSDRDFAVFASYLIRVVPSAEINPHYLKLTMGTSLYWEQLSDNTTGTGQPNVNATSLKGFILPLPPIAEQKRIVAKVDELMGLCDQFEAEKRKRDTLRQRLRASAFAALMNAPTDDALSTAWSFIHQHWHPLTQHPDDVEDVRRSLLQLAFSGSLTPRLEQTESVEQFAKKISEERQRLLEITTFRDSGNIKGEISESEQLFSIPDEWKWMRIGHAFLISSGTTPSRTKPEYFTNGTESWVKTTDLNNDVVMTCEEKITKAATEDCNLKYYPPGTVCVALYGGAGTIGKSGVLGVETTINQSVCGIYPNQFIDPFYSHWYIKLIRPIWMNFAASLRKAPNINAGIVNNMVFPLAPLAEQKRIVAKVDELMRECDQLEAHLRRRQQVAEQFAASAVSHLVV